jgi:hypothetical protein
MEQPDKSRPPDSPPGLLDWAFTAALLLALCGAIPPIVLGLLRPDEPVEAWSQWALLFAIGGAFAGWTLGTTGWVTGNVTRKKGLLFGVLAGTGTGLVVATVWWVVFELLTGIVALQQENLPRTAQRALVEWFSPRLFPAVVVAALLAAFGFAVISQWRNRRKEYAVRV